MTPCETEKLLTLATARYPHQPPCSAIQCLLWDRRAAGMGALGNEFRRAPIRNTKSLDMLTDRVIYQRMIDILPREQYADAPLTRGIGGGNLMLTVRVIPGRTAHMAVQVDRRDFETQGGRDRVARYLRQLRKSCRA